MIRLPLRRLNTGDEGTFGLLLAPSGLKLQTAELPWRDNHHDVSCIPAGVYRCEWQYSPKHKANCYHVTNVPGRSVVEIHAGNFAGDVTKLYQADLLGCIELGLRVGELRNNYRRMQRAVLDSRKALNAFHEDMQGEDFELAIEPITVGSNP